MVNNPSNKAKTESIDEVVLRLLGLKPGTEIDYQTYFEILRKKLAISRLAGKELPEEEDILLRSELKRVRAVKEKGIRIKIKSKKTKVQSSEKTTKPLENQKKLPPSGAIVKYKKAEISPREIIPVNVEDVTEKKEDKKDRFTAIRETLSQILKTLASKFKFEQKQSDVERRNKERERRGKGESTLEGFKKGISGIVETTKKLFSPFSDIIERIKKFLFFTLLGKAFKMFMDWMDNKENRNKFNAVVDFFISHWPAIVGAYILFGTSFGRLARGLVKGAIRMVIALGMNIPRILGFIKKNKKLSLLALGAASFASGYVKKEIGDIFTSKETPEVAGISKPNIDLDISKQNADQAKDTKVPKLNTGGLIPEVPKLNTGGLIPEVPKLNTGGLIPEVPKFNFGGLIPSIPDISAFSMGGMQGNIQSGIPISGAGKDDTLIAAKTGEAILTEKDQVDLSEKYVNKTTGEPLNIPEYLSDRKPGFTNFNNLKFGGGGFFNGGIIGGTTSIPKFNVGGLIGGKGVNIPNVNITNNSPTLPNISLDNFSPFGSLNTSLNLPKSSKLKSPSKYKGGGLIESAKDIISKLLNFGGGNKPLVSKPRIQIPLQEYQNPEVSALLKTIRTAEHYSSSNPYTAIYGGSSAPVNQMTIQEVIDMGNSGRLPKRFGGKSAGYGSGSAATGAYQFMPFTLQDLIRRGVAKPNEFMTPAVQDRLGWELAKGRGVSLNALRRTGLNQNIMDMMSPEWASFPYSGAGGKSYYGQPVKGSEFLRKIFSESLSAIQRPNKQNGGLIENSLFNLSQNYKNIFEHSGLVKENTGKNIKGATADRQLTALQPGEFVLPVDTVNRLGISFIEKLVAMTDSNSDAYIKRGTIKGPKITPYRTIGSRGDIETITLPAITQSTSGGRARASGYGGGSKVPDFSVIAPNNDRAINASIYGLIQTTV